LTKSEAEATPKLDAAVKSYRQNQRAERNPDAMPASGYIKLEQKLTIMTDTDNGQHRSILQKNGPIGVMLEKGLVPDFPPPGARRA